MSFLLFTFLVAVHTCFFGRTFSSPCSFCALSRYDLHFSFRTFWSSLVRSVQRVVMTCTFPVFLLVLFFDLWSWSWTTVDSLLSLFFITLRSRSHSLLFTIDRPRWLFVLRVHQFVWLFQCLLRPVGVGGPLGSLGSLGLHIPVDVLQWLVKL